MSMQGEVIPRKAAGRLKGKVAVVTGASKGIGASIAKELAAQGAAVVVNYSSSKEAAEKVVADIEKEGGQARAVGANVGDPGEIDRLFAETKKAFGKVDILVNNAGIYRFAPLEDITTESISTMFNVNVTGLLLATKAAVPLFPPEGGSIVNIGSGAGEQGPALSAVYSATKGAVNSITRVLANHQISISSVIQHEALDEQEGDTVPLVIMTHTAPTGSFSTAVEQIDRLGCVTAPSLFLPVAD